MVFVLVIIMSLFKKCERGNILFYFHSRLLGRENKIEFIFTPVY